MTQRVGARWGCRLLGALVAACAWPAWPSTRALPPAAAASAPAGKPAEMAPAVQTIVVEGRGPDEAEQRRLATAGVTVVGRDELDRYGDTSVLDVLQRLPGISVEGETPRMMGMGEGYTVVLINGERAPPGFSIDSLPPADIERIEVTKGPTTEHGGAAGVINIILRVPPKLQQREWRASLGYRAVRPQAHNTLSWGDRWGQGDHTLGFLLPLAAHSWANASSLQQQRSSRTREGELVDQVLQGRDQWLGQGLSFNPRLDWKQGASNNLLLQFFFQHNVSDNSSTRLTQVVAGPVLSTPQEASFSQGRFEMQRVQLQWQHKAEGDGRLELKAGAQSALAHSTGQSQLFDARGQDAIHRQSESSNRDGQFTWGGRWRQPVGLAHTVVVGWDLEQRQRRELRRWYENGIESVGGSLGLPFSAKTIRNLAFVQDEWAPGGGWSASIGVRAEHWAARTTGDGRQTWQASSSLGPVLNLRQALDGPEKRLLRLGLARSVRLPDLALLMPRYALNGAYERTRTNTPLAADSAGNPLLLPERTTGLDLALEQHLPAGGVLSASLFHRRIAGLIRRRIGLETNSDASVAPGVARWVSRPVNFGGANSSGLELEVKGHAGQLLPAAWQAPARLRLRAAVSLYRSRVEQVDEPEARLEGQSPWRLMLGMDWLPDARGSPAWGYGFNLSHVPAFSTQQSDLQRVWRSEVQRLDVYLLWRVGPQLQLRLAGQNVRPADTKSASTVEDLDGWTARSRTWRGAVAQWTAHLVWRY